MKPRHFGPMRHLAHLPNQDGFRFLGIDTGNHYVDCVVRVGKDGMHTAMANGIDGEVPCFWRLAGWIPRDTVEAADLPAQQPK